MDVALVTGGTGSHVFFEDLFGVHRSLLGFLRQPHLDLLLPQQLDKAGIEIALCR